MLIGDKAPDFSLSNSDEQNIILSNLLGKNVVIYFYHRDDTPGCTQEAKDFQFLMNEFDKISVVVLGISKDNTSTHYNFKRKYNLTFDLLSDINLDVSNSYGALVEKNMFGKKYMGVDRSTFIVDKCGIVSMIWNQVHVVGHVEEVLSFFTKYE